jgi:hypothetical protein
VDELLEEFKDLARVPYSARAYQRLRRRALLAGRDQLAALCLQRLAFFEKRERELVKLCRLLVSEMPTSGTYAMLGHAERNIGATRAAFMAFAKALGELPLTATPERRRLLEEAYAETREALDGNTQALRWRIATNRCHFAIARARAGDAKKEWALLRRHVRRARQLRHRGLELIYLDGLMRLAKITGDERRALRSLREIAVVTNTSPAYQRAALHYEAAGLLDEAVTLTRVALRRARAQDPARVEQLELKLRALRARPWDSLMERLPDNPGLPGTDPNTWPIKK